MLNAVADAIWKPSQKTKLKKAKVIVGDNVRISDFKSAFIKGHKQKYSNEVFKITSAARPKIRPRMLCPTASKVPEVQKFSGGSTVKNWFRSSIIFPSIDSGIKPFFDCHFLLIEAQRSIFE